jgi:hypothetical protein
MKAWLVLSAALGLAVNESVWADEIKIKPEGTSSATIVDVVRPKKFAEDTRITDKEMKAQAGSLSRYSLKFDLSYSGPAVNDLSDPNMPNPDGRPRPNRTSLTGYPALRYRMSPNDAINLSTGIRWFTPYQRVTGGEAENPPGENSYEISNPGISYDHTYLVGKTQMRSGVNASYITSDYYEVRGEVASVGYKQGVKYVPGSSRVTLGMSVDFDYYIFNREYQPRWPDKKGGDGQVSNYYLTYIPSFEYKILDNLNFKSSVGWSYSNRRADGSFWKWAEVEPTGRIGLGWAVTREVYFSPFLGFYTKHPSINTTNLAFSTVFSIF